MIFFSEISSCISALSILIVNCIIRLEFLIFKDLKLFQNLMEFFSLPQNPFQPSQFIFQQSVFGLVLFGFFLVRIFELLVLGVHFFIELGGRIKLTLE